MSDLVLLGEAPGEQEARTGHSFVGPAGVELLRMLNESGVLRLTPTDQDHLSHYFRTQDPQPVVRIWDAHPEVFRTNVFTRRPHRNDLGHFCGPKADAIPGYPALGPSRFIRAEFQPDLDALAETLLAHDPNLIVALGGTALWALCGTPKILAARGFTRLSTHCVTGFKVLPTYHPSAVLHKYSLRPTVIADLLKAQEERRDPLIWRPIREIWIEPTLDDIATFFARHCRGGALLSVDIETSGTRITCIGFAPSKSLGLVIPFDDERAKSGSYWPTLEDELHAWRLIREILQDPQVPKLFQNGLYDIAFLWRAMKIKVFGAQEDSMLLAHALQPEGEKGLGYLGSIFTNEGQWKHMRRKEETIKRDS